MTAFVANGARPSVGSDIATATGRMMASAVSCASVSARANMDHGTGGVIGRPMAGALRAISAIAAPLSASATMTIAKVLGQHVASGDACNLGPAGYYASASRCRPAASGPLLVQVAARQAL